MGEEASMTAPGKCAGLVCSLPLLAGSLTHCADLSLPLLSVTSAAAELCTLCIIATYRQALKTQRKIEHVQGLTPGLQGKHLCGSSKGGGPWETAAACLLFSVTDGTVFFLNFVSFLD